MRLGHYQKVSASLLAVAVVSTLTACGSDSEDSGSGGLSKAESSHEIVLGLVNFPPFATLQPDGSVVGVGPDIAKAVLKDIGITTVKPVTIGDYSTIVPAINSNRIEMFGGTLQLTPEDCKALIMTDPIIQNEFVAVRLKSDPAPPASLKAMGQQGLSVGVAKGDRLEAEGLYKKNGISQVSEFPNTLDMVNGLKAGRVDAVVEDELSFSGLPKDVQEEIQVGAPLSDVRVTPSGFAFKKGDDALAEKFNDALKKFKHTEAYDAIEKKYGFDPETARNLTAAGVCGT